ncbi:Ig-like domain-containing protein [Treponema sp.]|uniref:Ig-like domain-containing protein n=1 Tax=Treponema sp. TaxID=166 RepID=UPI003FA294A0
MKVTTNFIIAADDSVQSLSYQCYKAGSTPPLPIPINPPPPYTSFEVPSAAFDQDNDTAYKLIVWVTSQTGDSAKQTYNIFYDVKEPDLKITYPVGNLFGDEGNGFKIKGTALDNLSGLAETDPITATLTREDGGAPALPAVTGREIWEYNVGTLPEGKYILTVTAKDKVGNSKTETVSFTYNKAEPKISDVQLIEIDNSDAEVKTHTDTGNIIYSQHTKVKIIGNIVESHGLEEFKVKGEDLALSLRTIAKEFTLGEGSHDIEITAKDKAGKAASYTVKVVVDKTAPEFVTTDPPPPPGTHPDNNIRFAGVLASGEPSDGEISTSDNPIKITGLIKDPVSGIKEVYYAVTENTVTTAPNTGWQQLNGTPDGKNYKIDGYIERFPTATLPVGKTIHIKAVDNAGNEAFFKHKVKITSVEPAKLTFKIPEGTLGNPNNPSDTTAYIVKKHAGTLYAKGKFKITIGGYLDPVPSPDTITIDIKNGTTPIPQADVPGWFSNWTAPKILAADTPKDYVLANAPDAGEYTFTMTAQGQEKVLTVVVDTEGPSVTQLEPVTTSVDTLRPVLSASIFDNAGIKAGTAKVHYEKAGDAAFTSKPLTKGTDGSYSFTPDANMAEGTYTLYFSAEDNLGNKSKSEQKTVLIDITNPSLTGVKIDGKGEDTVSVKTSFAVEGKADDVNGIKKIQILDDGQSIKETTAINSSTKDWSISFTGTDLSEGTHKLTIRATDKAGKSTDVLKTVVMDRTAPTVELTYPAATSAQSGKITIQGSIDDGAQGAGVKAAATKWIVVPSASGIPTADTAGWKAMKTSTAANWSLTLDFTADLASGGGHTAYGPQNTGTPAYYDIPVYILTEDKVENKAVRKITVLYNPDGTKPIVEVLSPTAGSIVGGTIQIFGTGTVAVGTPDDVGEVHIQFSKDEHTFDSTNCNFNGKDWWNGGNGVLVPNTDGTHSGASWRIDVNGDGKLNKPDQSPPNPADDGRWELWFRLRAKNKTDNKMGEWTAPIKIVIDKFAPTIGSKIPLKLEQGGNSYSYVPNMWIADNYKLTGSVYDESGIKNIKITGDLKNGTEYDLDSAVTAGWIVEDTAHPPTESGKKNYKLQIPLTLSDLKQAAKEKQEFKFTLSVEEDTNKRLYAEKEFTFKIDTDAPIGAYGEHKLIGTGNFEATSITDTDIATKIRELAPSTDYSKLGILAGGKALTIQSVTGDKVVFTPAIAAGEQNYVLYSKGASLIYNANGDWVVKGVAHDEGIGVKEVSVTVTVNGSSQELTIPETSLVSSLSGLWSWEGQIDVSTLDDGKGTLSYEITDKRDNTYTSPSIEVRVKNKPVKISKVTLQTEIGGQTVKTDKTDPAETDPQTMITRTMDANLDQTVTVVSKNFALKSKTASKIKVEFDGEQQGTVKYRLKKGDTTIGDNLRSIPSNKEIVLTEDDLTAIGNSNGSTPTTITLEFWDEAHGFTQGTDSSWAKVNITTLFDALDQTNPAVVILPFHWNSKTDNSLYQNSRANGHIERKEDLPARFTDGNSDKQLDRDDKVSGKISIRGTAHDDHVINEILGQITDFTFAGVAGAASGTQTKLTEYDSSNKKFKDIGTGTEVYNPNYLPKPSGTSTEYDSYILNRNTFFNTNGWLLTIMSSEFNVKTGHTITWQLDWNSSKIEGGVGTDKIVKVTVKDIGEKIPPATAPTPHTASTTLQVDVVPYITGVGRNSAYNTKRARSGAIPLLRGEEDNTLTGFNFTTGSGTSLKITANKDGTGSAALEMENLTLSGSSYTFKVPDTAKDGYLNLVVNGVAAVNNTNAYTASNTEESDTYGAKEHSDDRFVHIWRVSKEDTFTGSKNAIYPAMTKDSNGTLYASFCNNSTAAVYYSKQFTGGTPVVVEQHGVNGVRRMFTGYDPPEETDIIVNGGEVNVLYAASYQGGSAYQWGDGSTHNGKKFPWNDTTPEYAGGIYLYDKDAAVGTRHTNVYRFELYTYDNELQQFKSIRTVRSGNNIYVVYYDALTAAVKFAWVDDSKKPDTRIHALPWCVIDSNTDVTDSECKVPDHLENTPGANPPDNIFTFVSPNGSNYKAPYILNNFEDGLTVSNGVWESVDVTVTKDGYPVVAYIDAPTRTVRLARSTSKQPTSPDDWKIQKVLDSSDKNGKTASDCVNACIGSDGILHIAFQNTRGQLVYVKSTNTSDTGSVKYAFGTSEILDDSGTSIEMTMDGTAPYITYMFRPNSYDAIRIAYKTSMDFNNTGTDVAGWETMTAPLNQRAASGRICIQTKAKHYNTTVKMPVAVGFKTNSDYRAAFYVGK